MIIEFFPQVIGVVAMKQMQEGEKVGKIDDPGHRGSC